MVLDIWNEKSWDDAEAKDREKNGTVYEAGQADFDRF